MKLLQVLLFATAALGAALPQSNAPSTVGSSSTPSKNRVVVYYQRKFWDETKYTDYISPSPLIGKATHVMLSAFHMIPEISGGKPIDLSNETYNDPIFDPVWADIAKLQSNGVKCLAMLGGFKEGTFNNLAADFEKHYKPLHNMLKDTKLDGVDIDMEIDNQFTLNDMVKFVKRLRKDFGKGFEISTAPVAPAVHVRTWISGPFTYSQLHKQVGDDIDFYNVQFYEGWGPLTVEGYMSVVNAGIPANKVVAGVANSDKMGNFMPFNTIKNELIPQIREKTNDQMGGIMTWEYSDITEPNPEDPSQWAKEMKEALSAPL